MKTIPHASILAFLSVALLGAPTASADEASPFLAPKDKAVVVFIQNLREDETTDFVVFDSDKVCVAKLGGREAEVVPMSPGRHTLYVSSYNNHRLELDLEAGRSYFIRLFSVEKFATRASDALPVQRGSDGSKSLKTWLVGARVTHARDDDCRGKPPEKRENRTQKRLNEANADWKHEDKAFRLRHILVKSDGLTATEVSRL